MNSSIDHKPEEMYAHQLQDLTGQYTQIDSNLKIIQNMLGIKHASRPKEFSPSGDSESGYGTQNGLIKQYSVDYIFEKEEPPVEYRLMHFNEVYKQRQELAKQLQTKSQMEASTQSNSVSGSYMPVINAFSEKIVQKMENRVGSFDTRLY